jgi:hypothetical protein
LPLAETPPLSQLCPRQTSGLALNSQTLAAFGAPRVDDQPAAYGFHAGAKAMSALAAYNGRLKCTFHDGINSLVTYARQLAGFLRQVAHPQSLDASAHAFFGPILWSCHLVGLRQLARNFSKSLQLDDASYRSVN